MGRRRSRSRSEEPQKVSETKGRSKERRGWGVRDVGEEERPGGLWKGEGEGGGDSNSRGNRERTLSKQLLAKLNCVRCP